MTAEGCGQKYMQITTVVATMMYDSSVLSSPMHVSNTCVLRSHQNYLLITVPRSTIVQIEGCGDQVRCAHIVSIR